MDFNLKQWRNQHESEDQEPTHSAKLPKLVLDLDSATSDSSSALPLFVSEPTKLSSAYSVSSDSTTTTVTTFPKMGSYFSLVQWQELELQALIYRHMIAGAPVPSELLHHVKKSLINSSPYYFTQSFQQYNHYQQALLQSGYWGRASMDPEPGRCRRTDGKKWRCSRDVVSGHKYCERHVHRGRSRSRKPVEIPTTAAPPGSNATASSGGGSGVLKVNNAMASHTSTPPHFTLSGTSPSSIDLLHLNQRPSDSIKGPLEAQYDVSGDGKSSGQILRHFFDDWPRQHQESENARSNASPVASATSLSISMPGNPSSDFSLKLSTGERHNSGSQANNVERSMWGSNQVSSMGGPLAEALRSSTSNSSPTSVLHRLQRVNTLEASYVST